MKAKRITRSERKLAIREEAKRKARGSRAEVAGQSAFRENVEKGLHHLNTVSSEGGDKKAAKIRNRLNYLLNNYLPQYDAQIVQLIDQWRRTGDPSYDPNIRVKLRQARRQHMSDTNPF